MPTRFLNLSRFFALFLFFLAVPTEAAALELDPLRVNPVATTPGVPTSITHGGDDRLFVNLQDGRILILESGAFKAAPFLDIRDRVATGADQGLFSTAFHPNYSQNGLFFIAYSETGDDVLISRFEVSNDPDVADASSERIVLRIEQPYKTHNGGQLQFGPDGYLYISSGDGGSRYDPDCLAQDRSKLHGNLLRLDIDQNRNQEPYHGIPADNPFVGQADVRGEIWSFGLRSPWRFSFDRATGDLYTADVGQARREEINFQAASSSGGENYGWKMMEGTDCTQNTDGCGFPIPGCNAPEYTPPILEYAHDSDNCSVIGGYVYRGQQIPELNGAYLYGDYCSGRIWAAERSGNSWRTEEIPARLPMLTTFGEDVDGEIFLADSSGIYRLDADLSEECVAGPTTLCLNQGRFRVELDWRTPQGDSGMGQAIPLTDETGYFWFFHPANVEIVIKALNGCAEPQNTFWIFVAGLTDVEVEITVTDSVTGKVNTYTNPLGTPFAPIQDTQAFATCP